MEIQLTRALLSEGQIIDQEIESIEKIIENNAIFSGFLLKVEEFVIIGRFRPCRREI